MAQYRALAGIEFPPDRRIEAGEVTGDIPPKSIKWLLEQGYIEPADGKPAKSVPAPAPEPEPEPEPAPEPEPQDEEE